MTEQTNVDYKEIQENLTEKTEQLKQRASEIEQQVTENINELMGITAERLDKAAEKMHSTAEFFRANNVGKIKDDVSTVIRENPGKSLFGGLVLGLLVGKILFK